MRRLFATVAVLLAFLTGCEKHELGYHLTDRSAESISVIVYAEAFNNLSSDIKQNIETAFSGSIPQYGSKKHLLVYSRCALTDTDPTPVNGYLLNAYRNQTGALETDTLLTVSPQESSLDPAVIRRVLNKVVQEAPADHYGLILSSHGSGWLPKNYISNGDDALDYHTLAPSKSFGSEGYMKNGPKNPEEIEIPELADAIPMHLDWIVFDACFMGCVEVFYELRNIADLIAAAPTEILSTGFDYTTLSPYLLADGGTVVKFSDAYYLRYLNDPRGGVYRSATITVVDCSRLENLAETCNTLFRKYRAQIAALGDKSGIQTYFRDPTTIRYRYLYDLADILKHTGADAADMAALYEALDRCILYKAATESFLELKIKTYCGMSMFLPSTGSDKLKEYYKSLDWNVATGLVN